MTELTVVKQELFEKARKKLSKKYKHIDADIENFLNSLKSKEDFGVELSSNIFKARIANRDKHKGKSAGYRLITYLKWVNLELHLIYIYDKSSIENLTEEEIDRLVIEQVKVGEK